MRACVLSSPAALESAPLSLADVSVLDPDRARCWSGSRPMAHRAPATGS
jgi:hypothetical protein